jgi:hypothetical protein
MMVVSVARNVSQSDGVLSADDGRVRRQATIRLQVEFLSWRLVLAGPEVFPPWHMTLHRASSGLTSYLRFIPKQINFDCSFVLQRFQFTLRDRYGRSRCIREQ